jgi:hypothetical protein
VILVDDRLCLEALAGRLDVGEGPIATTWGFHYRLVRALSDDARLGRLTEVSTTALRRAAVSPPSDRLFVLDPRPVSEMAARMAIRHRLNLLAAELVAAATHHSASVALAAVNVGRTWPDVFATEGIALQVVA